MLEDKIKDILKDKVDIRLQDILEDILKNIPKEKFLFLLHFRIKNITFPVLIISFAIVYFSSSHCVNCVFTRLPGQRPRLEIICVTNLIFV